MSLHDNTPMLSMIRLTNEGHRRGVVRWGDREIAVLHVGDEVYWEPSRPHTVSDDMEEMFLEMISGASLGYLE